ncbi:MAG: hypothetical protein P1U56_06470 [Saprospiraceae bacterium]|nr:hypothetical protein [Saprospiraceae bacterium]
MNEIIEGYRMLIGQRYQYAEINRKIELPDFITEETVNQIRSYFLEYIYPDYSKRQELNEAFESLDTYIKKPEKLLNMLLGSFRLLFTHGSHLPKILRTGLKAIKSFRTVSKFESKLSEQAIKNGINPPFNQKKIKSLMGALSRQEIEHFIENSESMVFILRDKRLIQRISEVLTYLIKRMKNKPTLYSTNEVKGIELGYAMLREGGRLFDKFDEREQTTLVQMIIRLERDVLDEVFK